MPTLREYKAAVSETYPRLSKDMVRIVASKLAAARVEPSAWNITETIQSGRAPGDGFMRCKKARKSDPFSDMHVADPTARDGVRHALAAARRVGA
jgi:hypothetical protein